MVFLDPLSPKLWLLDPFWDRFPLKSEDSVDSKAKSAQSNDLSSYQPGHGWQLLKQLQMVSLASMALWSSSMGPQMPKKSGMIFVAGSGLDYCDRKPTRGSNLVDLEFQYVSMHSKLFAAALNLKRYSAKCDPHPPGWDVCKHWQRRSANATE